MKIEYIHVKLIRQNNFALKFFDKYFAKNLNNIRNNNFK